jgi:fructose-specific phosphotransferase system IIA component
MPSLADLVSPRVIKLDLEATEKWEAIDELASLLDQEGRLRSREAFLKAVAEREAQICTSVGLGIAIPHARCDAVKRTSVAIGRSATGIQWDPEQAETCHLILLLAVPDSEASKTYMQLLAILARSLLDDGFREGLVQAADCEAVLELLQPIRLDVSETQD